MTIQEKAKALVVFSGGQDSTTCLYLALQNGYQVRALSINYGQKHQREIEAAKAIAAMAEVEHEVVDVGSILVGSSPLVNKAAPLEQYANHGVLPGGLEKTFVPMRNQFFLTIAANRAHAWRCDHIVTGVCEEDYGGYPDCRRVFIDSLETTCSLGTFNAETGFERGLVIATPLMHLTKKQTVELALTLDGCYKALAYSHTAYDGAYPPVGHDHATLLRAKGFEEADVPDPLVLRAVREGLMSMPTSPNYAQALVDYYLTQMA